MRPWLLTLLATALLLSNAACAAEKAEAGKQPSLAYLEKWVGKYPTLDSATMDPAPVGQRFWDDPNVIQALKRTMAPNVVEDIVTGWGGRAAQLPIEKQGDVLMISICRSGFCTGYAARVFLDLKTGFAQACWTFRNKEDTKNVDYWIGRKAKRLAENGCDKKPDFEALRAYGDK